MRCPPLQQNYAANAAALDRPVREFVAYGRVAPGIDKQALKGALNVGVHEAVRGVLWAACAGPAVIATLLVRTHKRFAGNPAALIPLNAFRRRVVARHRCREQSARNGARLVRKPLRRVAMRPDRRGKEPRFGLLSILSALPERV